ncbi:alpha/beta fold hydrolase [Catelliglobosispora koreensis]|uniref:alpha/beta fold hydrolase n=1 Tax=Catelliglobosispora koreensis TaxID=129052 RepID=UPI00037118E8|nr:alpha/beta hydrolase [Catelliglobosispora koreensis]
MNTLKVTGATLHYELRGHGPLVVLVGAPMDARSFAALADLLAADFTVLTTDPRGIYRSPMDNPEEDSTPQARASDLSALLSHVDAGPAIVLGSSGGAVTGLALAELQPQQVKALIAHEPPVFELMDNPAELYASTEDIVSTYLAGDPVGAWAKVMEQANIDMPEGAAEVVFGGERDDQQAADERRWFAHELRHTVRWRPDLSKLAEAQVIVGVGEESEGELAYRTATALATALGTEPVVFPGGHTGFADDPERFAKPLREILDRLR